MDHPVHPHFASWALQHHLHLSGTEGLPAVHFLLNLKNIGGAGNLDYTNCGNNAKLNTILCAKKRLFGRCTTTPLQIPLE